MRKSSTFLSVFAAIVILASLCGCETGEMTPDDSAPQSVLSAQSEALPTQPEESQSQADTTESATGELVVTFEYEKQSGYASNQFAVWVEDAGGNFVKTLYATRFTANGGYKNRPDSIPTWTAKSGLAAMSKDEVDAITGATPKADALSYTWNLTDADGNAIPYGEYRFFVEGSLRWKNRVLYSGVIDIGDAPVTVRADAQFFYEAGDNQPSLSEDSPETAMIGVVSASFSPVAGN